MQYMLIVCKISEFRMALRNGEKELEEQAETLRDKYRGMVVQQKQTAGI